MVLAVIPARGGSKSIPKKNIAPLNGIPLIQYVLEAIKGCKRVNHILVSTEDVEIALVAKRAGISVPFLRPKELAADDTPMFPVIQHAVRSFINRNGQKPESAISILSPITP